MLKNSDPVLSVRDLAITYAKHPAVDGINFDVERGKTLAIVGESGSGKSSTAMAIMKLVPRSATLTGSILLNAGESQDLIQLTDAGMRKIRGSAISMIFQEPMTCLNPVMKVGDQVAEAVRLHQDVTRAEALEIAVDSLRRVQLTDPEQKAEQYPHQLSGGMRQRVMIAMAMACKPALLIADEPTTALDVTTQAEMLRLISELQRDSGMSVIYITHDLGVVAQVADDVLVMRNGKCVEHRPVHDLFSNPADAYTRTLLASVPVLGTCNSEGPEKFGVDEAQPKGGTETAPLPQDGEKRLEVRDLCKAFTVEKSFFFGRPVRKLQAVQSASFELRKGETLSIVGESGSGKSTLARTVLQLVRADTGSVTINGHELVGLGSSDLRDHRADIQMVFQDPYASLNSKHCVGELVAEPLRIQGERSQAKIDKRVSELLELVNLPESFLGRKPSALSGGQRQRVCIARALSTNPSVLVLDEAVSALDVTIQAQIVDTLIDLQRRLSLSYIFISHDMGVVERISHRVAVMQKGRIVEIGSKRSVLHTPTHPYTKFLLSAVLRPDPSMRGALTQASAFSFGVSAVRDARHKAGALHYDHIGPDHYVLAEREAGIRLAG